MQRSWIAVMMLLLVMSTVTSAQVTLRFGIYATDEPSVVHSKLAPAQQALEKSLSEILGARSRSR